MKIERLFTKNHTDDVFATHFKTISVEIKSDSADSLFSTMDVEVPEFWSKLAVDVLAQNYLIKSSVPRITKKIVENGIPEWLQKNEAHIEALNELPENIRYLGETSAKQVFVRLAGAWTYWGYKLSYFDSEESAKIFFDEMCYILCHQIASPHSPHWFNMGLHWAYGIAGDYQGHFYYDESIKTVCKTLSSYERPQSHSCFIQGVEDNLLREDGLLDLIVKEARLFKYGSDSGTNFSSIRAKGEQISSGGVSSGLMSFLKMGDISTGIMNSGGGLKLASKRVLLDVDHPEIEDFISWKLKEEQKIVSLVTGSKINHKILQLILSTCEEYNGTLNDKIDINLNVKLQEVLSIAKSLMVPEKFIRKVLLLARQGIYTLDFDIFITSMDSESYKSVSGQNSNNTVVVSNTFLTKLLAEEKGEEKFDLINRGNGKVTKIVNARDLWKKINYSTWSCTEPSLNFDDAINDWHTCINDGRIKGSNTNGEYLFLDNTSCGLASINLLHFRKNDASFDTDRFSYVVSLFTMMLGICVSMTEYPSENIAELSNKYRPIGLSYCNMASYLMSLGLPYDSEQARNLAAAISSLLTSKAYETSAIIAKKKGSFEYYDRNASNMLRVLKNHRCVAKGDLKQLDGVSIAPIPLNHNLISDKNLIKEVLNSWDKAIELGENYGFRNAQVTSIAGGIISILMDSSTSGIEPEFALVKYKRLEDGSYSKEVNSEVLFALEVLGYSVEEIQDISNYMIGYKTLVNSPAINHESLKAKGFSEIELEKIEQVLSNNISNIEFVFNIPILGEAFCVEKLGVEKEKFKDPNFSLLQFIGFSKEEIINANIYVTGSLGLEKAPSLKAEHVPIFDCSIPNGKRGVRFLSWKAHIDMLASVQPFISGGISKTIILSKYSLIDDCSDAYLYAWKKGVKSASLFIEGSKLFQPTKDNILDDNNIKEFDFIKILQEKI